ncbi:MAG: DNA-binding response regulator [Bacteroidetes bacterium 24-39-8]|nr:MAG: DNA-binding response regulator [Sphingobacteriia bacterium 35-40-8]OYZ49291.1 MAG: DNA-binding response regulator [Bacteroidetes bacterium 24-39-8]OZA67596.1 MAG: DNA-binding response regulator [Sphingobacteriia bacterium 39-39-8]HQR93637.1 response regulator transcription factor [Sediminibacterium sp.]HQS56045.1 response regulator transcription factor [Sediminibacterium sp.]
MSDTKYIAIVDDHTLFRKGLASLIAVFPDYKILFDASTGKDFISQLNPKKLPDIVLMDISMPEMDGFATTEWLKNNYPQVKVLALSTMDSETAIIKMIKCGAKGYVLKDADLSELKEAFSELMRVGFYYNDIVSRKVMQSLTQLVDDKSELSAFMNLNENELKFIKLACSEKTYQQIAKEMFKSEKTIEGYRADIFQKLNISSRVGLAMFAIKHGIVKV